MRVITKCASGLERLRPVGRQRRVGALRYPQHRASGTRVLRDLGLRRLDRAADERKGRSRHRLLRDRQARNAGVAAMRLRREREKALDETILERMEADDGDASAGGEEVRDSRSEERQFRE